MKKLISTLLTIAMLLSLVPAVFAADTMETEANLAGVTVTYDILSILEGNNSVKKKALWGQKDRVPASCFSYAETKGFFQYIGNSTGTDVIDATKINWSPAGLFLKSSAWWAFKIYVPTTGVYIPKVKYGHFMSNGGTLHVSLVKVDSVSAINTDVINNNKLTIDGSNAGIPYTSVTAEKWYEDPQSYDVKTLEKGEYYVIYSGTGSNWSLVNNFILDGTADETKGSALMRPIVTADTDEIMVGDSGATLSTIVYDNNNVQVTDVNVVYTSSDEKVATVDGEGKVIGVGMGTATITATATKDGYSSSGTIDITVNSLNASGVTAVYDIVKGARDSAFSWNNPQWFLEDIGYDDTLGFWKYHSAGAGVAHHRINSAYGVLISGTSEYVAIEINVPESGDYNVDFTYGQTSDGGIGAIWILPGDTENIAAAIASQNALANDINYYNATLTTDHRNLGTVNLKKGKNLVVYKYVSGGRYQYMLPGRITLNGGNGSAYTGVVSVEDTVLEEKETTQATANVFNSANSSFNTSGYTVFDKITDVTFTSSNPDVATVEADGTVTAHKAGTATISATCSDPSVGNVIGTEITVNTPEYTAAFNPDVTDSESVNEVVSSLVYAKDGTKLNITPSATKNAANDTWTVSTDAESGDYKFLYWAKGLSTGIKRRIVSRSASFNYDAENEGNYLIAVYEKEGMKTSGDEYYNANGQLLENGNTLPYLAGYDGQATGWEDRGDGMHVAIFPEENRAKYTITVDGTPKDYYYGEPVVCTADAEKDGKKFFGWRKTVNDAEAELVSASTSYTFKAWEPCVVTAVYEDEAPVFSGAKHKIVLGTFNVGNEIAIMAEFIGFGSDVVERGISLNGTDIAMTTKEYNQFTIINNENLTNISGYAILADGTKVIYNK